MTAMHCVEEASSLVVALGEHNIRADIENHQAKVNMMMSMMRRMMTTMRDNMLVMVAVIKIPLQLVWRVWLRVEYDGNDDDGDDDDDDNVQYAGKDKNISWQTIAVERVIKRSDYDTNSVNNDIALLRLAEVLVIIFLVIIIMIIMIKMI